MGDKSEGSDCAGFHSLGRQSRAVETAPVFRRDKIGSTECKRQWLSHNPTWSQPSPIHRQTHMKVKIGYSVSMQVLSQAQDTNVITNIF